jgi:putative redox protein
VTYRFKEAYFMEIKVTFPGGKKVQAEFDGMVVQTDQPISYGGTGTAPSPYALFLSSIGTCAGAYILGFCQERGIPTEGITLTQRLEFTSGLTGGAKLSKVVLNINVPQDFPEKYHSALVRVTEQCAVKKAMADPPEFAISTVVAA